MNTQSPHSTPATLSLNNNTLPWGPILLGYIVERRQGMQNFLNWKFLTVTASQSNCTACCLVISAERPLTSTLAAGLRASSYEWHYITLLACVWCCLTMVLSPAFAPPYLHHITAVKHYEHVMQVFLYLKNLTLPQPTQIAVLRHKMEYAQLQCNVFKCKCKPHNGCHAISQCLGPGRGVGGAFQ